MKQSIRLFLLVTALFLVVSFLTVPGYSKEENKIPQKTVKMTDHSIVITPMDNGKALLNPGMGWVFHHYDNSINAYGEYQGPNYDGREFPSLSVAYLRLAWSFLEPKEGEFNWSVLDSVIQRYERVGVRFAFRLTAFEGNKNEDGVPQWLRKAGCPGFMAKPYGRECWEVDYASTMFLEKLANFLNAVGKRYGDNPNLEFVDIGTLGIWGEGHPIAKKYPMSVLKKHIELHKKAFPKTLLVANDDFCKFFKKPEIKTVNDPEVLEMILQEGLTLRDDSLNVFKDPKLFYNADMADHFWRTRPVILEMSHYDYAKKNNTWGGERYQKAIEDYHGSYASIHGDPKAFLSENVELIHQINRKLGYRIALERAEWKKSVVKNQKLEIKAVWKNNGVAPCLPGGYPCWTLINKKGDICAVFADETFNVKTLLPGKSATTDHSFLITPKLVPGRYTVCVSVGTESGSPKIALPHESCLDQMNFVREFPFGKKNEVDHLRYPLGEIEILSEAQDR